MLGVPEEWEGELRIKVIDQGTLFTCMILLKNKQKIMFL